MNTQQGNKLIAEFTKNSWVEKWNSTEHGNPFPYDKLKYHTSWDWLMPVIEKMSKIKCMWDNVEPIDSDTYYPRTFGMLDSEGHYMVRFNSCALFHHEDFIMAAWLAVTDFIQWYNHQPKK